MYGLFKGFTVLSAKFQRVFVLVKNELWELDVHTYHLKVFNESFHAHVAWIDNKVIIPCLEVSS